MGTIPFFCKKIKYFLCESTSVDIRSKNEQYFHCIYLFSIRPNAFALMALAEQNDEVAPRALSIILKDFEQEMCIILMLWAIFMIGSKIYAIIRQNYII